MCTFTAKPQSGLTHIDTNYVWSIMTSGWSFSTTYYYFQGDTLLNGHQWKKFYGCFQDSTLSNPYFHAGIREENGRVYVSGGGFTGDSLIYDHNLQLGDSVPVCTGYRIVDTVDYVLIGGQSRKRIVFDDPWGGWFHEIWVEGIGSNSGLPYALTYGCLFDIGFDLLCVHKDESLIWDNPAFEGCFISSIGIEEINSPLTFYPNPLTDVSELIVKGNAEDYRNLIIYDLSGRMVREVPFNNNRIRICKGDFTRGIYFYLLIGKSKNYRGKFIVQ
jgi:hypothetical protein